MIQWLGPSAFTAGAQLDPWSGTKIPQAPLSPQRVLLLTIFLIEFKNEK